MRDLEFLHEHVYDMLRPWQKQTALHQFAHVITDEKFLDDTDGRYINAETETGERQRYLPVDIAMHAYGIDTPEMFRIPAPDRTPTRNGTITTWTESSAAADACYDYTLDLLLTEPYDLRASRITDEVFHTVFPNRVLLGQLHQLIAAYVLDAGDTDLPDVLKKLFSPRGGLIRVSPPTWARNAVFFRDRGHCVYCGADLTRLVSVLEPAHFDHIVPLDHGGLNDVTNPPTAMPGLQPQRGHEGGATQPNPRALLPTLTGASDDA